MRALEPAVAMLCLAIVVTCSDQPPSVSDGPGVRENLYIIVDTDGKAYLNGEAITLAEMERRVADSASRDRTTLIIIQGESRGGLVHPIPANHDTMTESRVGSSQQPNRTP